MSARNAAVKRSAESDYFHHLLPSPLHMDTKNISLKKALVIIPLVFVGVIIIAGLLAESGSRETPSQADAPSGTAMQAQTPEEKIRSAIANSLSSNTNMKKVRFLKVDVVQRGGDYEVVVDFNADENLTGAMTVSALKSDMAKVYSALFKGDLGVSKAMISGYLPLADKYGNTSDQPVYRTSLGRIEAQKINWGAESVMLWRQIIPSVWEEEMVHPIVRQ